MGITRWLLTKIRNRTSSARRHAKADVVSGTGSSVSGEPGGAGEMSGGAVSLVALITRARAGDAPALERLATALYPIVRTALARRLRRDAPVDVDDVTQIAVARATARLDRCAACDDPGVRSWARAVAWRVALEELRTNAAALARRSLPLEAYDHYPAEDTVAGTDPSDGGRAEAVRDRLARAAVEALNRMPEPIGVLFWMRLIEDASWAEIAAVLGTTTAGVKRRFQRARATLHRLLARGSDA